MGLTGGFVYKGKLIARVDQPAQNADTQMTRYNIDLAANDRDAAQSVHQYNAKRQQEITQKNIYSSYEGIVDEVMVQEGKIISAGSTLQTIEMQMQRLDDVRKYEIDRLIRRYSKILICTLSRDIERQ